jgi:four helix bundle protein
MGLSSFRSYKLAVAFYEKAEGLKAPPHLRSQMLRASSGIVLNLAEGSARGTTADRIRFYRIALGSQRECTAILDLIPNRPKEVRDLCDQLGAHLFRLVNSPNI